MADFNELYNLIDTYKESYSYNDYYTEASDPAAEEFKSIVKSIKNNIKVCKNLIKNRDTRNASKLITTMEKDCNTLDGLVDKIKNPNALDTCGKVIIGVSALLGGMFTFLLKTHLDYKDADDFGNTDVRASEHFAFDDVEYRDIKDKKRIDSEIDKLADRYDKLDTKYSGDNWGFNNRHYKKYVKDEAKLMYEQDSLANLFYNANNRVSKDDYIKYLSKENPNNPYVKALKQGKSLKQFQKSQSLGTAAHIGAGATIGGTIPALILKKRRNVHTLIARLRKQINKLKVALNKIKK